MDAEKVFKALYKGGYTKTLLQRHTMLQTTWYNIMFDCEKCGAVHHLYVSVKDDKHTISNFSVKEFRRIHRK